MSSYGLVRRLSWKFILYQTSRPARSYPDPSRRSVSSYVTTESLVLDTIQGRCKMGENTHAVSIIQPMLDALERDIETYGSATLEGRQHLFSTALQRYIEDLTPYEAMAWWFVWIFTNATGSWGRVDGIEYFDCWTEDTDLDTLENLVTIETHHWTDASHKACLDEMETAFTFRAAMMDLFLFTDSQ